MRLEQLERSKTVKTNQTPCIEIKDKIILTDNEGYLLDPADWSPAVTETLAARDGVRLEEDHWILIDFLHRFYQEFEIAPERPILSRNLCKDRTYIKKLFPRGAQTACRYAGLPAPVGRSCL